MDLPKMCMFNDESMFVQAPFWRCLLDVAGATWVPKCHFFGDAQSYHQSVSPIGPCPLGHREHFTMLPYAALGFQQAVIA